MSYYKIGSKKILLKEDPLWKEKINWRGLTGTFVRTNNNITEITFDKNIFLKDINLSNNNINYIDLSNIISDNICLKNCGLTQISLPKISYYLDLSNNLLTDLPDLSKSFIKTLNISYNNIPYLTHLPNGLEHLIIDESLTKLNEFPINIKLTIVK